MQHKNNTTDLLPEIASLLLMNSSFSHRKGLFWGKMGAALFLYHYAEYQNSDIYSAYADELLLEILGQLNEKDLMYTRGAGGIAWGIDYLFKKEFVDVPPDNNIFSNINTHLIRTSYTFDLGIESCGITSYLFSRLKPDTREQEQQLEHLLLAELIIAQIDAIDRNSGKHERYSNHRLYQMLTQDPDYIYLSNFVESHSQAAAILKRAKDHNIYPEITHRLDNEVFHALFDLTHALSELSQSKTFDKKELSFMLNRLSIAYNACSQLSFSGPCQQHWDAFMETIITLDGKIHQAAAKEKSKESYIHLDLRTIASLSRLNTKAEDSRLAALIEKRSNDIATFCLQKNNLVNTSLDNNGQLNIGLTGLSGLGLILLSTTLPAAMDWDKSILFS